MVSFIFYINKMTYMNRTKMLMFYLDINLSTQKAAGRTGIKHTTVTPC